MRRIVESSTVVLKTKNNKKLNLKCSFCPPFLFYSVVVLRDLLAVYHLNVPRPPCGTVLFSTPNEVSTHWTVLVSVCISECILGSRHQEMRQDLKRRTLTTSSLQGKLVSHQMVDKKRKKKNQDGLFF